MYFYIHAYSRWIARVGVGFNFLKLPPTRKARKNVGGGGRLKYICLKHSLYFHCKNSQNGKTVGSGAYSNKQANKQKVFFV